MSPLFFLCDIIRLSLIIEEWIDGRNTISLFPRIKKIEYYVNIVTQIKVLKIIPLVLIGYLLQTKAAC